uniref:Potassium channel tetramerization domain containing 10 n=1 Tax=Oncorhynchus kisutch TaxID=8019 RepID=A0A8C7KE25_ONCKI
TTQTLTKQDTMFKAMFSSKMEVLTDSEGWILIDRCGKHFGTILNYLRDGVVPLPESRRETEEMLLSGPGPESYELFCKLPLVTSSKEDHRLIATSNKPTVKLLHNKSTVLNKDVIGDEICCWSLYGQCRKIAEVCCTSIVYATEKKQTKVEFPEAWIYEEPLNILLYESQDGRGPDNALLEATGGAAGHSHHLDEDEERVDRVRRVHVKRPDDRTHHHQ